MNYDPKPADERIEEFLQSIDYPARPGEIADETGLSQSYVTKRCKVMAEAGHLLREEGRYIVGHEIPDFDDPVILTDDRSHLLEIVRTVDSSRVSEAKSKTVDELRTFIRRNFVEETYPLGNRKVSYAAV